MNERIWKLAEQAGFENGHQDRNGNSLSYELEKFAELIVRECADKVDWILAEGGKTQGDLIRKHFGVEE
jgi:hypothetical protein